MALYTAEQKALLNRLGNEMPPHEEGNEAAWISWRNKVWVAAMRALPCSHPLYDTMNHIFMKELSGFDPAKGSLSLFLSCRVKLRHLTAATNQAAERSRVSSLEALLGEEAEPLTLADTLASADMPIGQAAESEESSRMVLVLLSAMVLNFSQRKGHANNPRRQKYYQMWYTEKLKHLMESVFTPDQAQVLQSQEKQLLEAVQTAYLDFFTPDDCRTLAALSRTGTVVRSTGEFIPFNKDGWLPARVPIAYLQEIQHTKASNSTISEQRSAYLAELRRVLGREL